MVQVDFPAYELSMLMSYKMAKFDKYPFCQKVFFMTPLHTNARYICVVYAQYKNDSIKALIQVNLPVYALSKHKQNKQTGNNG